MFRSMLQLPSSMRTWLILCLLGTTPAMAAPDAQVFSSQGVELSYIDDGSGTPVIFLHGFSATYGQALQPVAQQLGSGFRSIGFDQRGHGRSGKPHDRDAYGKAFADDVLNLMDHLGIAKAHLVGHSMGGIIAMYLAVHHPERFHSVVTIGNGLFSRPELTLIGWLMRGQFAWTQLKTWLGLNDEPLRSEQDNTALLLAVQSLDQLAISKEEAAAIKLPLLAVRGGPKDDPRNTVERLAEVHPSTQVLRIESADHLSTLSADAFLQTLKAFLTRATPGGR